VQSLALQLQVKGWLRVLQRHAALRVFDQELPISTFE
jgi:hypothetical protein